jgi:DNA-binding CsgD family transcriptional regulator
MPNSACRINGEVVDGRWCAPVDGGIQVLSEQAWHEISRSLKLSGREQQILRGVLDDDTERAIALNLSISPRTVHAHMERLHRKLGVRTRGHMIQRVMWEFVALSGSKNNVLPPICPNRAAGRCPWATEWEIGSQNAAQAAAAVEGNTRPRSCWGQNQSSPLHNAA